MKINNQPITLFYSYAHEDEDLRKELECHLSLLQRSGIIASWSDRRITPGGEWKDEIDDRLSTSQLILLLISPAFMASDYCFDVEMSRAMERHKTGETTVIPIIIRPVDWEGAIIGKLQALPTNARPVTTWTDHDEAFLDITKGIRKAVTAIQRQLNEPPEPPPPPPEDIVVEQGPINGLGEPEEMGSEKKLFSAPTIRVLKPVLISSLIAMIVSVFSLFAGKSIDNFIYDYFLIMRGTSEIPKEIIIVKIDEDSLAQINQRWPWSRDVHAKLIESLFENGNPPMIVAFDILFTEPSQDQNSDILFVEAIQGHSDVLLAGQMDTVQNEYGAQTLFRKPLPDQLSIDGRIGLLNIFSPNGVVRSIKTHIDNKPLLSYLAAEKFSKKFPNQYWFSKQEVLPPYIDLNFAGPPGVIKAVSYYQALDQNAFLPPGFFSNKLVFVGAATNIGGGDDFSTPFTRDGNGYMFGVEIHANAAYNLLYGNYLQRLSPLVSLIIGFCLATVAGILFFNLKPLSGIQILAVLTFTLVTIASYAFFSYGYYIALLYLLVPTMVVFLVSAFVRYREIYQSEQRIRSILANQVVSQRDLEDFGIEPKNINVFVSYKERDQDSKFLVEILDYVKALNSEGVFFWSKADLVAGALQNQTIKAKIAESDLALVLVSQSYLNSPECMEVEVSGFVTEKLIIIPIILSACDWRNQSWIKARKVLPEGDKTFAEFFDDPGRRNKQLLKILKDLRAQVRDLR